ncbi:hypothetical protein SAMN05216229_104269 [Geopseudomonas sagittaria]|uniref:Uncharacterized protein n=1 Tax=Geopseudomonas sagittaria TaxID=1135990 RepID=A0A1I5SA05_9GAMM|nr:hypothetical protein [Pseudomonas sagittaria]SFP67541.1 hypothetical protein SAMN05216229_104269 [Pseudomonas sagittaria]
MFRAHESVAVDFMGLLAADGYSYWRVVESELNTPWFHVRIVFTHEDWEESRILMTAEVYMLEHILSLQAGDMTVTDIHVVLPGWMTGRDEWSMERLTELRNIEDDNRFIITLYTVESGKTYRTGGDERSKRGQLKESRLIYCRS